MRCWRRCSPGAPEGYIYQLREDLTWELLADPDYEPVDLAAIEEEYIPPEEQATSTDFINALAQLGVNV